MQEELENYFYIDKDAFYVILNRAALVTKKIYRKGIIEQAVIE